MMTPTHPRRRTKYASAYGALALSLLLLLFLTPSGMLRAAPSNEDPLIQAAFEKGTLTEGQKSLEAAVAGRPATGDAQADRRRYALGIVQFLRAAEKLGQSWRHYGLYADRLTSEMPFLRLPVGEADPATVAPVSYEEFRAVLVAFLADLKTADDAFAALPDDPGKVALRPGLVRIDYAGDGKPADTETAWKTYRRLNRTGEITEQDAEAFLIKFDAGDVPWFRGYCHLLSALTETLLAYDESSLFDHTAHLFFKHPKVPFPFLLPTNGQSAMNLDLAPISDLVAFVHLLNFPVREPARLSAALDHLAQVPRFSRESWRRILAETDDDHEWIPNPHQTGALPDAGVTQERVDAWLKMLDEADAILAGRKLIPFWRVGSGKTGLNLRRVFTEPANFDLVLWIQGTAAAPYLENGTLTDREVWAGFNRAFSGEALGFSLYFN